MFEFDEKNNQIVITQFLDWNAVADHFQDIINLIDDWDVDEISEDEDNKIAPLFDDYYGTGLTNEDKKDILISIAAVWEDINSGVVEGDEHSIMEYDIIYEGIAQWIENKYQFDCRCW